MNHQHSVITSSSLLSFLKPRLWREGLLWNCAYSKASSPIGFGATPRQAFFDFQRRAFPTWERRFPEHAPNEPLTPYWQKYAIPMLSPEAPWSLPYVITCESRQ